MNTLPKMIVFITGAFLSHDCWQDWKVYYESKGYRCIAPPHPGKEGSPEELRNRHPDAVIASLRLNTLVSYYESIIQSLPGKPILIGHSLGGLIVQLLLQRNLAAAGIALHPFPSGCLSRHLPFIKSVWEAYGFFTSSNRSYMIPYKRWRKVIVNEALCNESKQLYYQYAIPESKLLIRDAFKAMASIDFKAERGPLLLTSGGKDKLITPSLVYCNYEKYRNSHSITDYMEFNAMNHLIFGHPLWSEEAGFVHAWLEQQDEHSLNS